jgi:serine/threonine protein phosphatase 1
MLVAAAVQGMTWWTNDGEQTLDSYGCDDPSSLPPSHLDWIATLPLMVSDQKRLFVHAGIRPGISIASQSETDLLWIREPFLFSEIPHDSFVVHGHTPTNSGLPDLRPNRLNIDTGACVGGELSAAAFAEEKVGPTFFVNSRGDIW